MDGVSFEVKQGEFYMLLGPSGCGKTTTLRCVAGLEQADSGEIIIGGQLVSSRSISIPPEQRGIGMVFQSYAIWPHMTIFRNVAFPIERSRFYKGLSKQEIRERVQEKLRIVHLEDLASRDAPYLSGGQQQRVALARALVTNPKVLLLDEPLSNLDAALRKEMRAELKELAKSLGVTTLYVTHDQTEALSLSDRVAIMQEGKIVEEGAPKELYETPHTFLTASFLGTMNVLKGVVEGVSSAECVARVGQITLRCLHFTTVRAREEVAICIRPESIELSNEEPSPYEMENNRVKGQVQKAEYLGQVVHYHLQVMDNLVEAMSMQLVEPRTDHNLWLHLPPERLYVFPAEAT